MSKKVAWGVLGAANIGLKKVIPAMQRGEWCEMAAITSRDLNKARQAASQLGISKTYGSYEELLADPEIEAVYNPLPNHLHVPWSIKAAEAGKHVLCEKPISLTVPEAITLLRARDRTDVKIQEAFMVGTHPQWLKVIDLVRSGSIGTIRSIVGSFSYFNRDPKNIRNIAEYGGGALMDIGCYLIYSSDFRGRTTPGCFSHRERSGNAHGFLNLRDSGLSVGTIHLYLQHAGCSLPESADYRNAGTHRS